MAEDLSRRLFLKLATFAGVTVALPRPFPAFLEPAPAAAAPVHKGPSIQLKAANGQWVSLGDIVDIEMHQYPVDVTTIGDLPFRRYIKSPPRFQATLSDGNAKQIQDWMASFQPRHVRVVLDPEGKDGKPMILENEQTLMIAVGGELGPEGPLATSVEFQSQTDWVQK